MKKQKENSNERITWSEMEKQNVQAKEVYWPETRTHSSKHLHLEFNLHFIKHNIFFLPSCCIKKRGLQSANCSIVHIKVKKQGGIELHRSLNVSFFAQRTSRFSDSRFLCCHLVEIEDVSTPRKINLFKYKT